MYSDESGVYRVQPNSMRLIHTETLELQKFPEGSIPPYAILSHVWGDEDDECRFQDFNDTKEHSEELKAKKGYTKIANFCRKAQEYGHTWAWVDTVCIDKTTYEEHNTAVNSMFAWYEQSEVCFVYLEDVEYCGPVVKVFNSIQMEESDSPDPLLRTIKQSAWFQRGWTLQEYIAPTRLSCFSREWTLIFVRDDVMNIHQLNSDVPTFPSIRRQGVVSRKLIGGLSEYTAAAKMRWVSQRHTRYLEDEAYCLLGIFGVQMPIRYGEGAQAFKRLQSLIMNVKRDPTLLIWSQTTTWSIPRGLMATSYLATTPSLFRIFKDTRLHHSEEDAWINMSLEREDTETAVSSMLNKNLIMYRPLIPTLDDSVSLIATGCIENPYWMAGYAGDVFVPVISAGGSRYRRANLPIIRADVTSTRMISIASPTEICLDDVAGNITRDTSGSAKTDSNACDTASIGGQRTLVIFPLGLSGFSFLAAFPGIEPSAPGTISMVESRLFHSALLVLENSNLSSRVGFLFLVEGKDSLPYYARKKKHATCRVLREEFRDVSKLGLQRVLERHVNCILLAAQKHNAQTQALWRRKDQLGQFYTEIGHFDTLVLGGEDGPGPNGLGHDYENLEGLERSMLILTVQVVLNCPETETRRKMLALHHADSFMDDYDG